MYSGAMQSILSELVRNEKLQITTEFDIDKPNTKSFAKQLDKLGLDNVLIVSSAVDNNLYLSARNIPNVGIIDVVALDPLSLLSYKKVLMTESAIKQLEERFK
jgi:large subunit ribosomal protein L4